MQLYTLITNQRTSRHILWCKNTWVDAGATIKLDGAYPTACATDADKQTFEFELANGWIDVLLVTTLPTKHPCEIAGAVPAPSVVSAPAKVTAKAVKDAVARATLPADTDVPPRLVVQAPPTAEQVQQALAKQQENQKLAALQTGKSTFHVGAINDFQPGQVVSLAGHDPQAQRPQTVSMFPGGVGQPERAVAPPAVASLPVAASVAAPGVPTAPASTTVAPPVAIGDSSPAVPGKRGRRAA